MLRRGTATFNDWYKQRWTSYQTAMDELPVQEIAARLDLGHKAAESLLTRARTAFRDAIMAMAEVPDALRTKRQDWSL